MNELDRILDRDHVAFDPLVDPVEHRGERRRFARTRGARDENQSPWPVGKVGDDLGQVELLERLDLERNLPNNHRHAAALLETVAAETRQSSDAEREIQLVLHLEPLFLVLRQHRVSNLERILGLQDCLDLGVLHLAVDSQFRTNSGGDVQVRGAAVDDLLQEATQVELLRRRLSWRGRRGGAGVGAAGAVMEIKLGREEPDFCGGSPFGRCDRRTRMQDERGPPATTRRTYKVALGIVQLGAYSV